MRSPVTPLQKSCPWEPLFNNVFGPMLFHPCTWMYAHARAHARAGVCVAKNKPLWSRARINCIRGPVNKSCHTAWWDENLQITWFLFIASIWACPCPRIRHAGTGWSQDGGYFNPGTPKDSSVRCYAPLTMGGPPLRHSSLLTILHTSPFLISVAFADLISIFNSWVAAVIDLVEQRLIRDAFLV